MGSFRLLAIVNNTAVSMACKYLVKCLLSILSGGYPRVELLDHIVKLDLIF